MPRIVEISRDPFSRTTLVRMVANTSDLIKGGCSWCGNFNRYSPPSLFKYGTEADDSPGNTNWHTGVFCSKDCHDTYHT